MTLFPVVMVVDLFFYYDNPDNREQLFMALLLQGVNSDNFSAASNMPGVVFVVDYKNWFC